MLRTLLRLKRFAKRAIGRDHIRKPDCFCNYKRFGSQYGGWDLVVDNLTKNSIIYSFGVGEDASFDTELIEQIDLSIHAFDPTPKSIEWVNKHDLPPKFTLYEYGLADFDGCVTFNPPENPDHVSHTLLERPATRDRAIEVPVKKLQTIMKELGHRELDVLKMDIEGAEYSVIRDMESTNIRPTQLLIEFHHRFPNVGKRKTNRAIQSIRRMGYGLFSVSESGEEYSFIYKSCSSEGSNP